MGCQSKRQRRASNCSAPSPHGSAGPIRRACSSGRIGSSRSSCSTSGCTRRSAPGGRDAESEQAWPSAQEPDRESLKERLVVVTDCPPGCGCVFGCQPMEGKHPFAPVISTLYLPDDVKCSPRVVPPPEAKPAPRTTKVGAVKVRAATPRPTTPPTTTSSHRPRSADLSLGWCSWGEPGGQDHCSYPGLALTCS